MATDTNLLSISVRSRINQPNLSSVLVTSSCPLLAGVEGEEPQPSYRTCGDQVSSTTRVQHQPGHARDTGEVVFTPVAQLVQTSVFNQWARSRCGPALVTSSVAVLFIMSPHHDCGHTEVAHDPEMARVQEEVCSAEERC